MSTQSMSDLQASSQTTYHFPSNPVISVSTPRRPSPTHQFPLISWTANGIPCGSRCNSSHVILQLPIRMAKLEPGSRQTSHRQRLPDRSCKLASELRHCVLLLQSRKSLAFTLMASMLAAVEHVRLQTIGLHQLGTGRASLLQTMTEP
jgi:hypothetical protein